MKGKESVRVESGPLLHTRYLLTLF
jgi:hypothetical protein